jgi:exodeoxyribonuclease VII small subunit
MSQTANKSISDKIATLDQAVEWFYGDDFTLDQAVKKYQSATKLAQEIEQDLSELKNQVEVLADFAK